MDAKKVKTHTTLKAVEEGLLTGDERHIDDARRILYLDVASLVSESYSRAYESVLKLQRLAEIVCH